MGRNNEEYSRINRVRWDEMAEIHYKGDLYGTSEFKSGKSSLGDIELKEIGDVSGKTVLHLQCHIGLDTLSLGRLGAQVTGVDFSEKAIAIARQISSETEIAADFIQCDIYDLKSRLNKANQFDMVFTTHGVIGWLHDLGEWAEIINHFLKPGGVLYLLEMHPFTKVFDPSNQEKLVANRPYFTGSDPFQNDMEVTYADRMTKVKNTKYVWWEHTVSNIINAIADAGLRIEEFTEHPQAVWQQFLMMRR